MSDGQMTYEDWLRGCVHHDGRHGYVTLPCEEVLKIADFIERLRAEQTEPQYDFGEYADRLWKIAYERGKREALEQTEPQTEREKTMMSPKEFAEKMQSIADEKDTERGHVKMDDLMCELLKSLGYGEGIKIFDDAPKWYA